MQVLERKQHFSQRQYRMVQESTYRGDEYWDWAVWIEADGADLSKIESVCYNLHRSFANPVRMIKTPENKFRLEASGWGTFTIYAVVKFKDETVLELEHELELFYPEGGKCEA